MKKNPQILNPLCQHSRRAPGLASDSSKAPVRSASALSIALGLMYCLVVGMLTGCINKQEDTVGQPTDSVRPYFGTGATIEASAYNAISMRAGDTITLTFPSKVTPPTEMPQGIGMKVAGDHVKLWVVQAASNVAAKGNGQPPAAATAIMVTFPSPKYSIMVYTDPLGVWPGDANADGQRNMLDLYAIARAINDGITNTQPCAVAAPEIHFPPLPGEMSGLYTRCLWRSTFKWRGGDVDYMHADCNFDGKIDELDADYLRMVIDPMYLPKFLESALDGEALTATYAPDSGGPELPIGPNNEFVVRLPFDIAFAQTATTPIGLDPNFFGVIFSRPVAESSQFTLLETCLDFENSEIFGTGKDSTVWRQKFWPNFELDYPDGPCSDASDRVLDVGAFRIGNPVTSGQGLRIGRCQVTLDDILSPGNITPASSIFTLIQHTVNGVVFIRDATGEVIPQTVTCSTDPTDVDLASLCTASEILLRDDSLDDGTFAVTPEQKAWNSPDIWVRHAPSSPDSTTHQQPIDRNPETVYVRIFNRSCNPSEPGTVEVLWTYANTHEKLRDFVSIGSVDIPAIDPLGNVVVSLPWTPVLEAAVKVGGCGAPLSLLAVISSGKDRSTSPLPTDDIHNWVLNSNNVAMRSVYTLGNVVGANCATIAMRPETSPTELIVEQVGGPSNLPASRFGKLTLQLSGYSGNPTLTGMVGAGQQYTLAPDSKQGVINLGMSTSPTIIQISFTPNSVFASSPRLSAAQHYAFRIYAEVGGVTQNSSIVQFTVQ